MNEDRAMEKEKILQVMEKYRDYFKEWNADVAFGTNKSNIFYVLASNREFETFLFFQTADQLEKVILGTIAENLDVILGAGIDEVNVGFSAGNMDEKSDKSIEYYLPVLVQKLDVLCRAGENWSHMLQVTFNSIKNVCADMTDREKEYTAADFSV